MPINEHTQLSQNRLPRRSQSASVQQPMRGVRQDNPTPPRARAASPQPTSPQKDTRAGQVQTNITRSHPRPKTKRRTVQLTLWVKPVVKGEIQVIAKRDGLSVSSVGSAFLENGLQQNLHTQHAALLDPIIDKAIGKHMRSYSTRIALLLVRVAFASEQTRSLVTNILSRQPGVSSSVLTSLLDSSSQAAKRKITHKTPQLESILAEVAHWFEETNGNTSG